jgi:DNA adenine methylase Dam
MTEFVTKILSPFSEEETTEELGAFGSPGGKSHIVLKLLKLVPAHDTYVEPFAGGAALYWKKEPVKTEVLNDLDKDIANAYVFIKNLDEGSIEKVKNMDWKADKEKFFKLRDSPVPSDPVQRFYRFFYVHYNSYGGSRKTFGYKTKEPTCFDKYMGYSKRMSNTKVFSTDYGKVIRKYDSPSTFIYLDPPYPNEWPGHTGTKSWGIKEVKELHDILKSCRGKWLLSINDLDWIRKIFSGFKVHKIMVPRKFKGEARGGLKEKYELLISNYDIKHLDSSVEDLAQTGSGSVQGGSISGSGLQPIWIFGKKKKGKNIYKLSTKNLMELIKNVNDYDVTNVNNVQLSDDWRIVNAWYSTYIKTEGKGIKFSKETIVNLAKLIYDELVKRVKSGMKHEFKVESMTPNTLALYKIVSSGNIIENSSGAKNIEYLDSLGDFVVIKDCISLIGSSVTQEHEPNDVDLLIRMREPDSSFMKRAVEVRLQKMVPKEIQNKLHFVWGEKEGPHDSFIPLFDLAFKRIKPAKIITMSEGEVKLFKPYSPQKPFGSAYYDLNKFLELFK